MVLLKLLLSRAISYKFAYAYYEQKKQVKRLAYCSSSCSSKGEIMHELTVKKPLDDNASLARCAFVEDATSDLENFLAEPIKQWFKPWEAQGLTEEELANVVRGVNLDDLLARSSHQ